MDQTSHARLVGQWEICLFIQKGLGMTIGRVWDGSPLSHSRPKIYGYFPPRPKLGLGRGMHSYPRFEVIIKIPSLARPDLGMCMDFVLPKKRGKQ